MWYFYQFSYLFLKSALKVVYFIKIISTYFVWCWSSHSTLFTKYDDGGLGAHMIQTSLKIAMIGQQQQVGSTPSGRLYDLPLTWLLSINTALAARRKWWLRLIGGQGVRSRIRPEKSGSVRKFQVPWIKGLDVYTVGELKDLTLHRTIVVKLP